MKSIKAIFFICIILFANLNIHVYQSWCHGENIGYTVNSKMFDVDLAKASKTEKVPSFKKDNCCKDVLIKSNKGSVYPNVETAKLSFISFFGLLPNFTFNNTLLSFDTKAKVTQLFSNPPPKKIKLHKFYCRYTYYG